MSEFQTIKTQAGMGLEAAADTGGPAIKLVAMSVGDGNGQAVSVSTTQTGLIHEVDRVNLNQLRQNPSDATQWVAEAVFPADRGGYTVREVGLWTDGGVLFAVANFPDTYKPSPSEGTAGQLIIQLNFRAANSDNVTLVVDGSLQMATREYVDQNFNRINGILSNVVITPPDAADYQLNQIGVNKASGDAWGYNAGQNLFFHLASVGSVQAESARAQAAEAKLQPAGDYALKSDLSGITRSYASPNNLAILGGGVQEDSGSLWFITNNGAFYHPAMDRDLQAESARAQAAEAKLQPAGNYLRSVSSGSEKIQRITLAATHGQRIQFPEPFTDDNVQVFFSIQDSGNNRFHVADFFDKPDKNGFSLSLNAWTGSTFANETSPTIVNVLAIGNG